MIEVDSSRRPFTTGPYDSVLFGSHALPPESTARTSVSPGDLRVNPASWSKGPPAVPACPRSDEEEDDDDEYRPFTPPPPRERLSYTRYQLELLNGIYGEVRYPNSTQKQLIAKRVGITREQVKIWFQNRRRKDVVGTNTGKPKLANESADDTEKTDNKPPAINVVDDSENSSEESGSSKASGESVVPTLVLKSVISELVRFKNDPLKGKKNRKKGRVSKARDKEKLKKGLVNTLLQGGYDMISPPNQITPTAFMDKLRSGFTHSKVSSAFESPGEAARPRSVGGSTGNDNDNNSTAHVHSFSSHRNSNLGNYPPLPGPPGQHVHTGLPGSIPHTTAAPTYDIPVLSDLLTYKSCLEARHKEIMSAVHGHAMTSAPLSLSENERARLRSTLSTSNRTLNGIFPFPFIADQPLLLSSLRQPDHIMRPHAQYPVAHEDPYQPLLISSLNNPYYSSPAPASWSSHSMASPPVFSAVDMTALYGKTT